MLLEVYSKFLVRILDQKKCDFLEFKKSKVIPANHRIKPTFQKKLNSFRVINHKPVQVTTVNFLYF